jgi:hypothetical protein
MLENFALIKKKINSSIPSTYFIIIRKKVAQLPNLMKLNNEIQQILIVG